MMIETAAGSSSEDLVTGAYARSRARGSTVPPDTPSPRTGLIGMFRSFSITRQLLVAMVSLVLLTSACVGIAVYWAVERAIVPQAVLRLETDTHQLSTQLVARTRSYRENLMARAQSGAIAGFVDSQRGRGTDARLGLDTGTWRRIVENLFTSELSAKADYLQLRLIDTQGNEVIRVDRQSEDQRPHAVRDVDLQSKADRDYVADTLALETGQIYVSPIDLNRERGEISHPLTPVLRFATPIDDATGTRFGMLILNIDMREPFELLRESLLPSAELFILNADGDFLLHPDAEKTFRFDYGAPLRFADDRPQLAAVVDDSKSGSDLFTPDDGPSLAVAWTKSPVAGVGPDLSLVMTLPGQIARAAPAIRNTAAAVGAIAALIATLVAAVAARAIVRPIVSITDGLADASAGRPFRLPTSQGGEIGILARALDDYIEREHFDSAIINGSNDAILTTDRHGLVTRWNPAAAALFECPSEKAIGRDVSRVIPTRGRGPLHDALHDPDGSDGQPVQTLTLTRKDGSYSDVSLQLSPVHGSGGEVIGLSISARDVTAEREAQEMFRLSVEHSPAGKVLVAADGRIILVNAQIERTFGFTRSELVGGSLDCLLPHDKRGEHSKVFASYLAAPQQRTMGNDLEVYGRRRNGEIFPIEVGLTPVPSRGGTLVLAAVVDVSEQRAAQKALLNRTEELERSNKDLMQFAYVASHDLQEPLRMVASFTQLLADRYHGKLDERADKYIHFAVDGAKRMQSLIHDLLEYSRVGATAKQLVPTAMQDVWERVQRTQLAAIRSTDAVIETGELPTVMADVEQLSRLLQNLLSNALKFRSDATPLIRFGAVHDGDFWRFTLSDNGIGFDARDGQRVFEMFQRLHERGRYDGTGLGLAIAQRIVAQHGGRIWAESTPGEGSTFYFTLPAAGAAPR